MAIRTAAPRSPKVPEIRKGDTVVVLAGKDAGKRGTVEQVIRRMAAPSSARSVFRRGSSAVGVKVVVEGLNLARRPTQPRQSTPSTDRSAQLQPGGNPEHAPAHPIGPARAGRAGLSRGNRGCGAGLRSAVARPSSS